MRGLKGRVAELYIPLQGIYGAPSSLGVILIRFIHPGGRKVKHVESSMVKGLRRKTTVGGASVCLVKGGT